MQTLMKITMVMMQIEIVISVLMKGILIWKNIWQELALGSLIQTVTGCQMVGNYSMD